MKSASGAEKKAAVLRKKDICWRSVLWPGAPVQTGVLEKSTTHADDDFISKTTHAELIFANAHRHATHTLAIITMCRPLFSPPREFIYVTATFSSLPDDNYCV